MTQQLTDTLRELESRSVKEPAVVHLVPEDNPVARYKVSHRMLPYMTTIANMVDDLSIDTVVDVDVAVTEETLALCVAVVFGVARDDTLWYSTNPTELAVLAEHHFSSHGPNATVQLIAACEYLDAPLVQRVAGWYIMRYIERQAAVIPRTAYATLFDMHACPPYVWPHVFQHCEEVQLNRCLGCVDAWDACMVKRAQEKRWELELWTAWRVRQTRGDVYGLPVRVTLTDDHADEINTLRDYITAVDITPHMPWSDERPFPRVESLLSYPWVIHAHGDKLARLFPNVKYVRYFM